jgi:hypothetical protein
MAEVTEAAEAALEREGPSSLNALIAILVAVSATFAALCNIKDGNVVQSMAQAQAGSIDTWAFYQAKSTKQHLVETALDQLTLQLEITPNIAAESRKKLEARAEHYRGEIARYEKEKAEIQAKAQGLQQEYDHLNIRDDQFDMAEATLSLGIALYGITALTRKKGLLAVAIFFSIVGTVLGLAGFLGWSIHPDFLARLLT